MLSKYVSYTQAHSDVGVFTMFKYNDFSLWSIDWMIDFNGMLTRLGLFYA